MQKHQAEFMKVVKEYNQQINMLLGMAQTANRRQSLLSPTSKLSIA